MRPGQHCELINAATFDPTPKEFYATFTIIALAVAGPSVAAPFEPGVYLGATTGRASVSSKYADNSSDISLGGLIGYQYTPNFGFDVYTRGLSFNPSADFWPSPATIRSGPTASPRRGRCRSTSASACSAAPASAAPNAGHPHRPARPR